MEGALVRAYEAASGFFVAALKAVPGTAWAAPALGTWSVRDLVGHANRAHTLVEEYLLRPVPPQPPDSDYFSPGAIAARAREAAMRLGDHPEKTVTECSQRTIALIRQAPAGAEVSGPMGTMALADYLPSRTAELTVHTLDLTRALGTFPGVTPGALPSAPAEALAESLRSVTSQLVRRGHGETALLALSGRAELPPGFSAY